MGARPWEPAPRSNAAILRLHANGHQPHSIVMTTTPAPRRKPAAPTGSAARSATVAPARRLRLVPPVLVRQLRDGFEESAHRGDIVQVDAAGRVIRALGDPNRPVLLRSAGHPFGVLALIEAGGIDAFNLEPAEIAIMAGSHSGEDMHVRTVQGILRRAMLTQALLACGSEGMPLDPLTSARLARDGEKAGPVRHMCSGQHGVAILLCKLNNWETEGYWMPTHPAQELITASVARAFGTTPARLRVVTDSCGLPTFVLPLHEVARAYALLAQPSLIPASDPRASLAPALSLVRDAMLTNPEMVAGSRDRIDTSLMKTVPGRIVSKSGEEGLRAAAILPVRGGGAGAGAQAGASGVALKIEDGGPNRRAGWASMVETLVQVGLLDHSSTRVLGRYYRPGERDDEGRVVTEAVATFDLLPVGQLVP